VSSRRNGWAAEGARYSDRAGLDEPQRGNTRREARVDPSTAIRRDAANRLVGFAIGYTGLQADAVEEKRGCHEN
jgi:hypothetical protein